MVDETMIRSRSRPSHHGAVLGEALAQIAEKGRCDETGVPCTGCAFRRGTYANQSAETVASALGCLTSEDEFACHKGLVDGEPVRPCAGYLAALRVRTDDALPILEKARDTLAPVGPDPVRADVDAWLARVDPNDELDDYQRSDLWARRAR